MIRVERVKRVVWLVVMVAVAATAAEAAGADTMRHSGTVVAFDKAAGRLVLGEVGPWRVKDGVTRITELRIALLPGTAFVLVKRVPDAATGFPEDWAEAPLDPGALKPGDFVTVECLHQGERLVALKVTATRP